MSRRNKNYKKTIMTFKVKTMYPMVYCLGEKKAIGVSKVCIKAGTKVKVDKTHWNKENAKYLKGYELDLENAKVGDKVFCPHCKSPVDFRMWISDTEPDIK